MQHLLHEKANRAAFFTLFHRMPAMAAGLIAHPMSYQEYIWLPVHLNLKERDDWKIRATELDLRTKRKAKRFCFKGRGGSILLISPYPKC